MSYVISKVSATSFKHSLSIDSLDVGRKSLGTRLMFQVISDFLRRKNLRRLLSSVHQKFLTVIDSSTQSLRQASERFDFLFS